MPLALNSAMLLLRRPAHAFARSWTRRAQTDAAFWSEEWKRLGLRARAAPEGAALDRLAFVQLGFGCDQHGRRDAGGGATKAAVRACRNAIEFNSIPGMVELVPSGRKNMLVHVKLGVPPDVLGHGAAACVDLAEVAAVFPYGCLLPIDVVAGGLTYGSGRVVPELGDEDDTAVVVVAAVSIGYDSGSGGEERAGFRPKTWDTRDGH